MVVALVAVQRQLGSVAMSNVSRCAQPTLCWRASLLAADSLGSFDAEVDILFMVLVASFSLIPRLLVFNPNRWALG